MGYNEIGDMLTDGGAIVARGCDETAWHILVTAGDANVAIIMLSLRASLEERGITVLAAEPYHNNLGIGS